MQNEPVPRLDRATAGPPGIRATGTESPASVNQDEPTSLPGVDDVLSFERHIKPLFRPMEWRSITWAFDLWSNTDVSGHAPGILARPQNGSMPCDGAWTAKQVTLFQRWFDAGMLE